MTTVARYTPPVPAPRLAQTLAEHDLPGRRSKTAITRLRRARAKARGGVVAPRPAAERVEGYLLGQIRGLIAAAGGETGIEARGYTIGLRILDRDVAGRLTLVGASGWRRYGRTENFASLAYLSGVDAAGRWVVRVPSSVRTVAQALAWTEPAEVARVRQEGRRVAQVGGVYAIETTRAHDGKGAGHLAQEGFAWRPGTRYLVHRPAFGPRHRPLSLRTWPGVRFVTRKSMPMGR
ncbi:hypothetical protein ABZ234_31930 [Nocardiopsis sp. NPDC006198]|uniref:hypothetical protein n=1 Tax=Nocardiopsis sp. NPDC006198 TaxID=3154472 RepID=UPI0033B86861